MTTARALTLTAIVFLVSLSACSGADDQVSMQPEEAADSVPDTGEWVTILERTMESRLPTPEPFRSTSDSLRVITEMGNASTPYTSGVVTTNLFSSSSVLPIASVRAEQFRTNQTTIDTAVVWVGAGSLEFFIAEQRNLTSWKVTLQEQASSDPQ